jgi:polar amino acid transport system substrate-binding protein
MRRASAVGAILVAAALALTACGGKSTSSSAGGGKASRGPCTPAGAFKPVKPDTLTVVTSLPGPGFWEGSDSDPSKIRSGYEYDLAKTLQRKLCLSSIVVRNEGFDAIVGGQVTDYDISLSQISITDKRKKVVDFTQPYFESQQGVLIKKGSKVKVTSIGDAKKVQWGVQTGTTALDLLKLIKPTKRPQVFQQLPDAYTALDAGQIDAVLIDTAINLGEAARSKGAFQVVSQFAQKGGPDQYGGIVPKGSTNLATFDKILLALKGDGTLKSLAKKDLTADPGTLPTITVP